LIQKDVIQLPVPVGSTQKILFLYQFDLGEEIKFDSSLSMTIDKRFFIENGTRVGDRFCCGIELKPVDQRFKISFKYKESNQMEVVDFNEGIIPGWTELASIPKSRFDSYGPNFFNETEVKRVFSSSLSLEDGNVHMCVATDPSDLHLDVPILKKHVHLASGETTTILKGCIALLQNSNDIILNDQTHYNVYYAIANTENITINALNDTKIVIIRLDDKLQDL
jgi:hypothetical protein